MTVNTDPAIGVLTAVLSGLSQLFLTRPIGKVPKTRPYALPLPPRKDAIASSDITNVLYRFKSMAPADIASALFHIGGQILAC